MTQDPKAQTAAPDLPCPKCGGTDVSIRYEPEMHFVTGGHADHIGSSWCSRPDGEHFDRYCRRCGFHWVTRDVLAGG